MGFQALVHTGVAADAVLECGAAERDRLLTTISSLWDASACKAWLYWDISQER